MKKLTYEKNLIRPCRLAVCAAWVIGGSSMLWSVAVTLLCLVPLAPAGLCEAAETRDFFTVDVKRQKSKIDRDLGEANAFLAQTKLQNARSSVDLLEHEFKQIKSAVPVDEATSIRSKIDKIISVMTAKEDSLVKRTIEILHTQGVDPALQFAQNDLRMCGVPEKKIAVVEKTILEEAPTIKQEQERDAIARTLKALKTGAPLDPSIDSYIVKTAQRMIKATEDSLKSIEDAKARKAMEEKERVDRIKMEKELQEKKKEEERLAKVRMEEEKKKRAQEDAERVRQEAAKKEQEKATRAEAERQKVLLAQQEKARKDSLDRAKKQDEQQAKLSEEQRKQQAQQLALQEKARKDSLDAARKLQDQQAKLDEDRKRREQQQKKEPERVSRPEPEQQKQAAVPPEDKTHKDSVEAAQKQQEFQARLDEDRKRHEEMEQKEKDRALRAEADKQKQSATQQEKVRKDSLDAVRKQQDQQAKLDEERKRQQIAQQQENDRLARAEAERQKQLLAQQEKVSRAAEKKEQVQAAPAPQVAVASPRSVSPAAEEETPSPEAAKSAREYLTGLRDNQKKAQDLVMELYEMVERKQAQMALDKFKQDRKFIAQYVETQVFNTLEQAIFQGAMETQAKQGVTPGTPSETAQPAAKPVAKEEEMIEKINSYVRDNKLEAAYAEFKRTEKQLKRYMTGKDFKLLKDMVENAYKIRKKGGSQ